MSWDTITKVDDIGSEVLTKVNDLMTSARMHAPFVGNVDAIANAGGAGTFALQLVHVDSKLHDVMLLNATGEAIDHSLATDTWEIHLSGGDFDVGETARIAINDVSYDYVVVGGDSIADVTNNLAAVAVADTKYTVTSDGVSTITLVAKTAGAAGVYAIEVFYSADPADNTMNVTVVAAGADAIQDKWEVTASGPFTAGELNDIIYDGVTYRYQTEVGDTATEVAAGLAAALTSGSIDRYSIYVDSYDAASDYKITIGATVYSSGVGTGGADAVVAALHDAITTVGADPNYATTVVAPPDPDRLNLYSKIPGVAPVAVSFSVEGGAGSFSYAHTVTGVAACADFTSTSALGVVSMDQNLPYGVPASAVTTAVNGGGQTLTPVNTQVGVDAITDVKNVALDFVSGTCDKGDNFVITVDGTDYTRVATSTNLTTVKNYFIGISPIEGYIVTAGAGISLVFTAPAPGAAGDKSITVGTAPDFETNQTDLVLTNTIVGLDTSILKVGQQAAAADYDADLSDAYLTMAGFNSKPIPNKKIVSLASADIGDTRTGVGLGIPIPAGTVLACRFINNENASVAAGGLCVQYVLTPFQDELDITNNPKVQSKSPKQITI